MDVEKCALCGCEKNLTRHHLCPRVKCHNKYKAIENDESNIIVVCEQCHGHIHAVHSENELRDSYNTLEKLFADEKVMKFVSWRKKHMDFDGHAKMSNDRKRRR